MIFLHMILFGCFSYGQNKTMHAKSDKMEYGSIIEIKRGATVVFEDGLSISPQSFSHKNSLDGITKASVYIVLSINNEQTEKFLSVYSSDSQKSEEELNTFEFVQTITRDDGTEYRITSTNYDRFIFWKAYEIQLKEFEYDEFIKVLVTKKSP